MQNYTSFTTSYYDKTFLFRVHVRDMENVINMEISSKVKSNKYFFIFFYSDMKHKTLIMSVYFTFYEDKSYITYIW